MALLEVCVENVESYRNAVSGGAKRIELCSALSLGGLTPTMGLFHVLKKEAVGNVPIFVMIRPREGDFVYNDEELAVMEEDIRSFKEAGADGFVFGVLTAENNLNREACSRLIQSAEAPCTFHRAFDVIRQPLDALESIIQLGFSRILTSGQKSNAIDGLELIGELERRANRRIIVMAGAGITDQNAGQVVQTSGVREIHGSASVKRPAGPTNSLQMGSCEESNVRRITCRNIVHKIVTSISSV